MGVGLQTRARLPFVSAPEEHPMRSAYSSRRRPRATPVAIALSACLAVGLAHAQSTTGGINGIVRQPQPEQLRVVVRNLQTGAALERTPDAQGRYALPTLAPGRYQVQLLRGEAVIASDSTQVVAGTSARVDLTAPSDHAPATDGGDDAVNLARVTAVADAVDRGGINPIDVTTPQISTVVPVALLDEMADSRSAISTAGQFLAQVSTANSSGFPRFSGASGAENRYYVNEFDVTNDRSGYGLTGIPAEAMASMQIIDDNAPVRYSNAMGGSLAQTFRQGTNDLRAGYVVYYTPPRYSTLQPAGASYRYPDGRYYSYPNGHGGAYLNQFFWTSGAIVKDRLFFFALLRNDPAYEFSSVASTGLTQSRTIDKLNWPMLNLTWNISDGQQLNLMAGRNSYNKFTANYDLQTPYDAGTGSQRNWTDNRNLQELLIGNYFWNINDSMTLSLMGGYMSTWSKTPTSTSDSSDPYVLEYALDDTSSRNIGLAASPNSLLPSTYFKRGYRAAFTWTPGDHQIGIGAENYDVGFNNLQIQGDNGYFRYRQYSDDTPLPNGVVIPAMTPFVERFYQRTGGSFNSTNRGIFAEDTWAFAPNWVLYAGVRRDESIGRQVTGRRYLSLKTTSPRVGLAWDMLGDGSTKLGFNWGRYTIPLPASINAIVGGRTDLRSDYFDYAGRNADGSPILGAQYGDTVTVGSSNPSDPRTIASGNIRNSMQENLTVYLQRKLSQNWQGSVQAKYNDLKRTIETTCDIGPGSAARDYLAGLGYPDPQITNACILYNPGSSLRLTNDFNGDGALETVTIPNTIYRMPEAKRRNYQLIGTLTHAESTEQPYFLTMSYAWGHQYGNYEGYYDETTGQSIASSSYAFDYPELTEGATGNLSNDYRHNLKARGFYRWRNGLRLGGSVSAHTGGPRLCNSYYPNTEGSQPGAAAASYGNFAYYCNETLTPRGSLGRLPTFVSFGLIAGWGRKFGEHNVDVALNVSNVFNREGIAGRVRGWNAGGYNTISPTYGFPSYQSPRSVGLVGRYTWN